VSGGVSVSGDVLTLPSWVPAAGEAVRYTQGGGTLTNNLRDVFAPYYDQYYDVGMVSEYSGPGYAPDIGDYGAVIFYGLGHSAGNGNQVNALVPSASGLTFVSLSNPTAWTGSTATDSTNKGNNSYSTNITSLCDTNWGDAFPHDGTEAPPGIHSYSSNVVIPAANGGATYGSLFSAMVAGGGTINIPTLGGSHELAINSTSTPASNTWSRVGTTYFGAGTGYQGPLLAEFVPDQDRVYYAIGNAGSNVRYYTRSTETHTVGHSNGMVPGADYNTGRLIHVPPRSLLLHVERNAGKVRIRWMDVSVSNPQLGGTATLSTDIWLDPFGVGQVTFWTCACWCPDNNRLMIGKALTAEGDIDSGGTFDENGIFEIAIPTTLTDTWTVTRRTTTGVSSIGWDRTSWAYPAYLPKIKCMVIFERAKRTSQGADSIVLYRPVGT
jgi:hypothetical protein